MKHELIDLTKWPSMPLPMQSSDPGEAWIWGDFFATLQKDPILVAQGIQSILGKQPAKSVPMAYPYAMTVFYDKAKNPHGPSSRPVLCIGLERVDYGALAMLLGGEAANLHQLKQGTKGPVMVGVFSASGRTNLGIFDEFITADSARERFFDVIRAQLGPTGEPIRIGAIKDVYGHPNTGWPANSDSRGISDKSGCFGLIVSIAVIIILIWRT